MSTEQKVDGLAPAEDWTDEIIREVERYYYLSAEAEAPTLSEAVQAAAKKLPLGVRQ